MVTKLLFVLLELSCCFILAKNHMVTKQSQSIALIQRSFILAKNHMVTKPQIHVTIYLKIIKY